MTIEEAISRIDTLKLKIYPPTDKRLGWLESWVHKKDIEAFDMAIKALEQELSSGLEKTRNSKLESEDCISREAVLKLFATHDGKYLYEAIRDMPSVDQEPKIVLYSGDGYADGYMVYDMAECPNCGYEYEYGDKDWGENFCPHCGQPLKWESEVSE